jgi:hypothetical protein
MHQAEVQVEKHFCWNYLSSERKRRSGSWFWNNPRKDSHWRNRGKWDATSSAETGKKSEA